MKKFILVLMVMSLVFLTIPAFAETPESTSSNANQTQSNEATIYGHTFNSDGRGYLNSPIINYPSMPNLFVNLPDGKNIRSLRQLLIIKSLWTKEELQALADGAKIKMVDGEALNKADSESNTIRVYFGIPTSTKNMELKSALFTDCKVSTNSFQSFAVMALKALDEGANVLCIETEGASHELYAKSAGVMIGGSVSQINGDSASIGTGGIGFSCGSAGYRSKPYHHGFSFISAVAPTDLEPAGVVRKMTGGEPIAPAKTQPVIK